MTSYKADCAIPHVMLTSVPAANVVRCIFATWQPALLHAFDGCLVFRLAVVTTLGLLYSRRGRHGEPHPTEPKQEWHACHALGCSPCYLQTYPLAGREDSCRAPATFDGQQGVNRDTKAGSYVSHVTAPENVVSAGGCSCCQVWAGIHVPAYSARQGGVNAEQEYFIKALPLAKQGSELGMEQLLVALTESGRHSFAPSCMVAVQASTFTLSSWR
jgi:hypothetical protein